MKRFLNAFQRVVLGTHATDTLLGCPSPDEGAKLRRLNTMSQLTGGRGFPTPAQEPKPRRGYDGRTRGQEKRRRQALANQAEVDRQRASAEAMIAQGVSPSVAYSRFGSLQGTL